MNSNEDAGGNRTVCSAGLRKKCVDDGEGECGSSVNKKIRLSNDDKKESTCISDYQMSSSSPLLFDDPTSMSSSSNSSSRNSSQQDIVVASDGGAVPAKVINPSRWTTSGRAARAASASGSGSVVSEIVAGFLGNASRKQPNVDGDCRRPKMTKQQQANEVAMAEAALLCDLHDDDFTQLDNFHMTDESNFYGLPKVVGDLLKMHKGIDKLYDWQDECLRLPAIVQRRNLIYSLPTSGGKTLVAEILMWKEVLRRHKDALLILPYVSIVQEKVQSMSAFAIELEFSVEEYAGSKGQIPPRAHRKKNCIYIATIEKAHTLINILVENHRLEEIGLVAVDEFHMIGDGGSRGATLECLLTKLLFMPNHMMIVAMSATLGNIDDLRQFLNADVYFRNFRPVELKEYIKVDSDIYMVNTNASSDEDLVKKVRTCSFSGQYTKEMTALDPDYLGALVLEVVPNNSCLIFCQTRKNCENVAMLICKTFPKELKSFKTKEKLELYEALKNDGNGRLCPVLHRTLPYGVAYHHSGLTVDERRLLEEAYSAGTLCCITCTSTLAAGVNLPAKRVIVRSPYIGSEFITHSRLKQMIGRAGRAGIDTSGESILIVKCSDAQRVGNLLSIKEEECLSSLAFDNNKGLKTLLLSAYGLNLIKTEYDAIKIIAKTLYSIQNAGSEKFNLKSFVQQALNDLSKHGLLDCRDPAAGSGWSTSKLGRATFKGSINLDNAKRLYDDLKLGLKSLALNSYLHLLYLITPYEMVETTRPIPNIYYDVYASLPAVDLEVAHLIGITEACMARVLVGQKCKTVNESVLRRFYMTLVLNDLWRQNSVWHVADKYQLPRGHVQNLLTSSASFATCVLHFCQELEDMWAYQDLLVSFVQRLSHCVHSELIPLMELPCIKQGRARLLYEAGYKRLELLAKCEPEELVRRVSHMPWKVAKDIVTAAKVLVLQKADALQEEAEDLISGLEKSAESLKHVK